MYACIYVYMCVVRLRSVIKMTKFLKEICLLCIAMRDHRIMMPVHLRLRRRADILLENQFLFLSSFVLNT